MTKKRVLLLSMLCILIIAQAKFVIADALLDSIRALPGVITANEAATSIPSARFFQITFEQLVDHNNPTGPTFAQRMTLLHRSETAPMVLAINGYDISFISPSQREITAYLECNQLHVEHRFFTPSIPNPVDWHFLTIEQSAADLHEIVQSFKNIYAATWISTGSSKGGQASVYHRYFYSDDVKATVPYVAPSSHGIADQSYVRFVYSRGTSACRQSLLEIQQPTNAFSVDPGNDSYRLFVTGIFGNHTADISHLSSGDQDFALAKINKWVGISALESLRKRQSMTKSIQYDHPSRHELFLR